MLDKDRFSGNHETRSTLCQPLWNAVDFELPCHVIVTRIYNAYAKIHCN